MTGKLLRRIENAELAAAGICVILMMLIVFRDAVGRYAFGAPLAWSFDLVSNYLMVGAAYFALSSTYRHGDHININLLHAKLPISVRNWVDIACCLLTAALFAVIAYGTFVHMVEAYQGNEFFPGYIMWPAWLSYLPIPLGSGLLVLRLLHHSYTLATQGHDSQVETEGGGAE